MESPGDAQSQLTLEQLSDLRQKTESISRLLQTQLKGYLDTLRPLLLPAKLLGRYAGRTVKEDVTWADSAFTQLRDTYKKVCGKPFSLLPELDDGPLGLIEHRIELYPWEYSYDARDEKETKTLTITSPVRWILTFGSAYTPTQLRDVLAGRGERQPDKIRQFVVNTLVMSALLAKFPGVTKLLTGLRYEIHVEKCPGFGELALVSISACVPSFRPPDGLMSAATRFSGVPAFIELIDPDGVHQLQDPVKQRIEEILSS